MTISINSTYGARLLPTGEDVMSSVGGVASSDVSLDCGVRKDLGISLREEFPIFRNNVRTVEGRQLHLAYLDSATTAQKPVQVIHAMSHYLEHGYGSVHRGAYTLSVHSSQMYEGARAKVAGLLGSSVKPSQVIFTRGTTEALNLAAHGLGARHIRHGSRVVIGLTKHHANMLPWRREAQQNGAQVVYIPLTGTKGKDLRLDLRAAAELITANTAVVAVAHVGNVLGQVNPLGEIANLAHKVGARVVVDCAQSFSCFEDDLFALGVDAVALSAHKMYGPSGIGVLAIREELVEEMAPLLVGGSMVADVTLEDLTLSPGVRRYEAGTPPIVEAVGLAATVDWLHRVGRERIHRHAANLTALFSAELRKIPGIQVVSPCTGQETLVSFHHESIPFQKLAEAFDQENVAIRAGHHCAIPLIRALGYTGLARVSFGAYSDTDDVESALRALRRCVMVQ